MKCPRCGTENAESARYCSNCGQSLVPQAVTTAKPLPDPNTAFVLELLLGLFGFLGMGWIYAGHIVLGLVMLVGWWLVVISGLGGSFLSGGLGCCLWLPIHVVAPLVSALIVRGDVQKINPWR